LLSYPRNKLKLFEVIIFGRELIIPLMNLTPVRWQIKLIKPSRLRPDHNEIFGKIFLTDLVQSQMNI